MAVDLNNPEFVSEWSPHAAWKWALLIELGRRFGLRTFVETGTCWGGTIEEIKHHFYQLYSVELCRMYYESATERFAADKHVHLYFGSSDKILPSMLEIAPRPALIWLDAHYTGGESANEGDPLPSELETAFAYPDALIVVDDISPDYVNSTRFDVLKKHPEWKQVFRNGVLILTQKYYIPERF